MATDAPLDGPHIVFKPETFDRHDAAVRYVEQEVRTRAPRPSTSRFPGLAMGAWGLLHPGDMITAGSGLTLGSGTVTLCTRDGGGLTDTGEVVTVYNNGAEISGGAYGYGDGTPVAMEWTDEGWSVCECGPPSTGCTLGAIVTFCNGSFVVGATVTFKQGGTVIGTCTTGITGACSIDISSTGAGDYNVSVAKTGLYGSNKDVTASCPGANVVSLVADTLGNTTGGTINGCNTGLPDVLVTINGGTYTTDASGVLPPIPLPNGTFPWTASKPPRWADMTGTMTIAACSFLGSISGTMTPASGYACFYKAFHTNAVCNEALANPLTYSGPTGSIPIYYDAPTLSVIGCGTFTGPLTNATNPTSPCGSTSSSGSVAYAIQWQMGANSLSIATLANTGPPFTPTMFTTSAMISCSAGSIVFAPLCTGQAGAGAASSSSAPTCPPSDAFETHGTFSGSTGILAVFNGGWTLTE